MIERFPHPCNSCGYCCLIQVCPIGLSIFGGEKYRPCPALEWQGTQSRCGVVEKAKGTPHEEMVKQAFGIDTGCCIKARVRDVHGNMHDFASLPDEVKISLTQRYKAGGITTIQRVKK